MIYASVVSELAAEVPDRALTPIGTRRARDIVDRHLASLMPDGITAGVVAGEPAAVWGLTPDEIAQRQTADRRRTRIDGQE